MARRPLPNTNIPRDRDGARRGRVHAHPAASETSGGAARPDFKAPGSARILLQEARAFARDAPGIGDDATNDLLVSDVIRSNEQHVWFVSEHVVDMPLGKA